MDMHNHILPGIDDGSPDEQTSIEYARQAYEGGVEHIICTPHVKHSFPLVYLDELVERVWKLQHALRQASINMSLSVGGEIGHDMIQHLTPDELQLLAHGPDDGRWLLLEAPLYGMNDAMIESLQLLRASGIAALIAHPERCPDFLDHLPELQEHFALHLQMNVGSLWGIYGSHTAFQAWKLLQAGLITLFASDAHPGSRVTFLHEEYACLGAYIPPTLVAEMMQVRGEYIWTHGLPSRIEQRRL